MFSRDRIFVVRGVPREEMGSVWHFLIFYSGILSGGEGKTKTGKTVRGPGSSPLEFIMVVRKGLELKERLLRLM